MIVGRASRVLVAWVVNAIALLVAARILDGFDLGTRWEALGLAAVLGVLNAFLAPVLIRLALPITVVTLGFGALVLNGGFVLLAARVYGHGVKVDDLWTGVIVAVCITIVNTLITTLLAIDDDDFYYRNVVRRQARRKGYASDVDDGKTRGILFLEIDGLAHDVLRLAMRAGNAPNLSRWLREGTHVLSSWECDWSSQTGAMQAGILHGSNFDMPAFRWWEKDLGKAMVSNRPRDAMEIERRHSNGRGLLHHGGASRANLVSGDAPYTLLTMSTVLTRRKGRLGRDYFGYFANPYSVTRTLVLIFAEIFKELRQQVAQRRHGVWPRVHRGWFPYPLLRAFTNVIQRDLEVAATILDVYAGRPVIYTMFLGYDEVSHHSGVERAETLAELEQIDRQVGRLERAIQDTSRPYEIVVLSDHGQTQGATFLQRYDTTLEELVAQLAGIGAVRASEQHDEGWGYLKAAATEVGGGKREDKPRKTEADGIPPELVVMASGCLGLVYLGRHEGRVTLERIDVLYPDLVPGLRAHPGVGFVLVRSEEHGAIALGRSGAHYLDEDRVEGDDPLTPFGPNAAEHVRRTDSFPHCGDLVVNSTFWADLNEVAAFEELVGSHGGMGGTQQHPFVLHPAGLVKPSGSIVGAEHLHRVFRNWLAELGHDTYAGPFEPMREHEPAAKA